MKMTLRSTVATFVLASAATAGHAPSIQFSQDANALRDQVLKASGDKYGFAYPAGYSTPNKAVRDLTTGNTVKIDTRKPNHQYQVNSLDGKSGAAGGWVGVDSNVPEGFVWTPTQGTTYVTPLPGHVRSEVLGVSSDGNAAYGKSFGGGSSSKNFYWTRDGQMIDVVAAANSGSNPPNFQPKRMLSNGSIEGLAWKSGTPSVAHNATWTPSQGVTFGSVYDHSILKKASSAAGSLTTHYDIMDYTGELRYTNTAGDSKTLLHFEEAQAADAVWLSPDGKLAIANLDLDQGWNLQMPRAGVFHTDQTVPDMFPADFLLSDYLVDELGLEPKDLQGKYLYSVSAISPDGNLIFGSAGTYGLWDPFADAYFLIDLRGNSNPAVPEPATWMIFVAAGTLVVVRRRKAALAQRSMKERHRARDEAERIARCVSRSKSFWMNA